MSMGLKHLRIKRFKGFLAHFFSKSQKGYLSLSKGIPPVEQEPQ